jgi:hypothetical protein
MKAAIYTRYGPPDVVRIQDVDEPVPADNEVLIEVRAASVNPLDWHFLRGTPRLGRVVFGLSKPKNTRLGVDVAGRVEAVGRSVTRFNPGDVVFGVCKGAFAEYTCASESTGNQLVQSGLGFHHAGAAVLVRQPEAARIRRKGTPGRPGHAEWPHDEWRSHTGCRQALSAERNLRRHPLPGNRARTRKGDRHGWMRGHGRGDVNSSAGRGTYPPSRA